MIYIVDFGGQYSHLIYRHVYEITKEVDLISSDDFCVFRNDNVNVDGIILSGSPNHITESKWAYLDDKIAEFTCPILGICFGYQAIGHYLGAEIIHTDMLSEYGKCPIIINTDDCDLFYGIPTYYITAWMSHGDSVNWTAEFNDIDMVISTVKESKEICGIQYQNLYGVQFHPEVTHTEYGVTIIRNFIERICHQKEKEKDEGGFTMTIFDNIGPIKDDEEILLAASGGI